jgi:hypothetical protein
MAATLTGGGTMTTAIKLPMGQTPAEAHAFQSLAAVYFEQAYREEIARVQRFGGDLAKAREFYHQWHAYREAAEPTAVADAYGHERRNGHQATRRIAA